MAMNFGYDEHPPNHIHNIKPLVALPMYNVFPDHYIFTFTNPTKNVKRKADLYREYGTRWDIDMTVVEPMNTSILLSRHTFDTDTTITELTIKYELRCLMKDGTIEEKLIDEFDLMPFKVGNIIDDMNHFHFQGKKFFFISMIQPNYKNMFKASVQMTQTSDKATGNENHLVVSMWHRYNLKKENTLLIKAIEALTQTP